MSRPFQTSIAIALALTSALAQAIESKPNVVVIMADDIGLGDLSYYQSQRSETTTVQTPNIDKLFAEGMHFSDAHSPASLCAPTRFSMLTGNFSYRNARLFGVWTPEADALIDPDNTTSARIAKAGGYHTSFFGKWGLGGSWKGHTKDYTVETAGALAYGFDYAVELPEGIQNKPFAFYENQHFMPIKPDSTLIEIDSDQTGYTNSKKHNDRGGIGDSNWDPTQAGPILVGKAVDYIEKQTHSHPDEPFFMYYCSQAVHIPHTPPAELDGVKIAGSTAGIHGDMIRELDVQVGMIVRALKKAGVYENTLLIFTSDNGGLSFDRDMKKAGHDTSNGLNGSKGSIGEGGHRIPFVAVWPGQIAPGSKSDESIVGHDVVATLAALAEQPLDRNIVKDSMNLLPILTASGASIPKRHLMHQSAGGPTFAIRDEQWKLVIGPKGGKKINSKQHPDLSKYEPIALFNLETNLFEDEAQNQIRNPEQSQRVERMWTLLKELRTSGAPTVGVAE